MKYQRWPKRDTDKCYFKVPNEVFCLDLDSKEISIYAYLLRCEDRDTYQCHPSYRTIGKAVKMCENTVRKYVLSLEEKGLIRTEPTTITTKDGRIRNGSLRYTIRPIQEALEIFYQRQFTRAEEEAEKAEGTPICALENMPFSQEATCRQLLMSSNQAHSISTVLPRQLPP